MKAGLLLRHTSAADGNLALHSVEGTDAAADAVANRKRTIEGMGLTLDDLVVAEQVHGAAVQQVTRGDRGRGARTAADAIPATDGLVTRDGGVALLVLGADCPIVCLFDPKGPGLALLHAGWRGIVAGVLRRGMEALDPKDPGAVQAFLGASAGPCCYRVGPEVASRFPPETIRQDEHLDLPAAVECELGVPVIRVGPGCTVCNEDAFSHRRTETPFPHGLAAALHIARIP